jgi:predicted nucleic-acid-binding protein
MIGVDTNILLRAVMADDAVHTPLAQEFLRARSAADPAYVNSVVLAEFVWSLRVAFRLPRERIGRILQAMIESESYLFEHRKAVIQAFCDFQKGLGAFTDRLIAEINADDGCAVTGTFDKQASGHPPFHSLA